MTVSIIIAVKTWGRHLEECVSRCLGLDYPDFEIIILPDAQSQDPVLPGPQPQLRIIPTGPLSPGEKRDLAVDEAKGEILAFIDDDAYPRPDWLKNAMKNFSDPEIAAVGGPAITPREDSLMQRASGRVYALPIVSGTYTYRYAPGKRQKVDDYPSCNFLVRKSVMQELGGFDTAFWPGEDTKLCQDITQKIGKKIVYDPEALVYHHRRPLFMPHLKQVSSYALHRGYFVKRYPRTSFRLSYFIPSFFLLYLTLGAVILGYSLGFRAAYFSSIILYLLLVFAFSVEREIGIIPLTCLGAIFTHITYGFYFFKGLFSKKLKEE